MSASASIEPHPIPKGDVHYEVVDGVVVEAPSMGVFETHVSSRLCNFLFNFAKSHQLGRVENQMLFVLDAKAKLMRRPDVAFVSFERWSQERQVPETEAWDVVPELAVEVVSESNTAREILRKTREGLKCFMCWMLRRA